MKILSLDPGKNNFAFAVIDDTKVVRYGMLKNVMENMTGELTEQISFFAEEIMGIIKDAQMNPETDFVYAERFMYRPGKGSGAATEFINVQLGALACAVIPLRMWTFPSATWKNYMSRTYPQGRDSKDKLDMRLLLDPDKLLKLTPHEADAIGIGMYRRETNELSPGRYLLECLEPLRVAKQSQKLSNGSVGKRARRAT